VDAARLALLVRLLTLLLEAAAPNKRASAEMAAGSE